MVYISDEEIDALPEEPMEKFIALERIVRERYEKELTNLDENQAGIFYGRRYMAIVLPAAQECGIKGLMEWQQPSLSNESWQTYDAFIADVDFCLTKLRLRRAARIKEYSVALDGAGKAKLRHLTAQVRAIVDKLEISVAKKDRLYKRLSAFELEIDRARTPWQAFGALAIEAADDAGASANRVEPVLRAIERIGAALGVAKRAEDARPQLPKPAEAKQIEGPKKSPPNKRGGFDRPLDDEIPF